MLNAPLDLDATMNLVRDVTSVACGFFEVGVEFPYPVVTEIFLGMKFLFTGLLLVCNSY